MNKKKDAGPEYLHSDDFMRGGEWKEYTLTISEVIEPNKIRAGDGSLIEHYVLSFEGAEKKFILGSKTNLRLIKFATGSSLPAEWVGKRVTLAAHKGDWFGQQNVAAIRIQIPPHKTKPMLQKKHLGECLTGTREVVNANN